MRKSWSARRRCGGQQQLVRARHKAKAPPWSLGTNGPCTSGTRQGPQARAHATGGREGPLGGGHARFNCDHAWPGLTRVHVPELAVHDVKVLVGEVAQHLRAGSSRAGRQQDVGEAQQSTLGKRRIVPTSAAHGKRRIAPTSAAQGSVHPEAEQSSRGSSRTLLMSSCSSTSRSACRMSPLRTGTGTGTGAGCAPGDASRGGACEQGEPAR